MKVFHLLYLECARSFYRWAMREIDPLHPDMSKIVLRLHELEVEHRRMWS